MSIEMILGIIGTVLGVANFVYWAWWAKRDKVAILINERYQGFPTYANFVPKGKEEIGPNEESVTVDNHSLHIHVGCALVLTSGDKELEVMGVLIRLHKETSEKLKKYFRLPPGNCFSLHRYAPDPKDRELGVVLEPKKYVDFTEDRLFECTDKFEERCKQLGFDLYPQTDDYGEYTVPPEFIKPLLEQLRYKFELCWTRYDGKELCWKFPQKLWRNLGKRLWG